PAWRRKMASSLSRLLRPNHGARFPLALTVMLVALGLPRVAEARRYTLAELIEHVNAVSPGVQAAREGVAGADAQLSQATSLWYPSGQLTFGLTGSPEVRCVDPITRLPWTQSPAPDARARALNNCLNTSVVDLRSGEEVLPVHGAAFNLNINL